jgi:hypothetical protein
MTQDDLLAAGYTRFKPDHHHHYADWCYHRAVWKSHKKAYILNVYFYDAKTWPDGHALGPDYRAEANFFLPGEERSWLTLEIHQVGEMPVERMEAIFFEAWVKLGCVHDPNNN